MSTMSTMTKAGSFQLSMRLPYEIDCRLIVATRAGLELNIKA